MPRLSFGSRYPAVFRRVKVRLRYHTACVSKNLPGEKNHDVRSCDASPLKKHFKNDVETSWATRIYHLSPPYLHFICLFLCLECSSKVRCRDVFKKIERKTIFLCPLDFCHSITKPVAVFLCTWVSFQASSVVCFRPTSDLLSKVKYFTQQGNFQQRLGNVSIERFIDLSIDKSNLTGK